MPPRRRLVQVVRREDSETYAKRTISEIETCLGFRFQPGAVGGEEPPAEVMDDSDIQQLNTQLEAALASGLSFKDKLRTDSAKKLMVPPTNARNEAREHLREEPQREGNRDLGFSMQQLLPLQVQRGAPARVHYCCAGQLSGNPSEVTLRIDAALPAVHVAAAAREEPARRPPALEAGKPKLGGATLKLAVGRWAGTRIFCVR